MPSRSTRAHHPACLALVLLLASACGGEWTGLEPLRIVDVTLPDGMEGRPYSTSLQAQGGDGSYMWAVISGALPSGLVLDPALGTITGALSQAGTIPFRIGVASGDGQTVERDFSILIEDVVVLQPTESCSGPSVLQIVWFADPPISTSTETR